MIVPIEFHAGTWQWFPWQWFPWQWFRDNRDAVGTLGLLVTAILALWKLTYDSANTELQRQSSRHSRFTSAVEKLRETKDGVRNQEISLASARTIHRIAKEHREHYRADAIEILSYYLRSYWPRDKAKRVALEGTSIDRQAAFEALMDLARPGAAVNLRYAKLRSLRWPKDNARALKLDIKGASLIKTDLTGCDLRNWSFCRVLLHRTILPRRKLLPGEFVRCIFTPADKTLRQSLSGGNPNSVPDRVIEFNTCRLQGVDLSGCDLRGVRFRNCDLRKADFTGCDVRGTEFSECENSDTQWKAAVFSVRTMIEWESLDLDERLDGATLEDEGGVKTELKEVWDRQAGRPILSPHVDNGASVSPIATPGSGIPAGLPVIPPRILPP